MSLSEAKIKEYVAKKGIHCPYCDSTDLSVGRIQPDEWTAWQDVECEDCGKSWIDDYALIGITEE